MVLANHITVGSFGLGTVPKVMGSILEIDLSDAYWIRALPSGCPDSSGILTNLEMSPLTLNTAVISSSVYSGPTPVTYREF